MAISIGKEEGIAGLYRGLSPALLRHVFYTSIRIVAYENLRTALSHGEHPENLSVAKKAFIGGTSGIIGQVRVLFLDYEFPRVLNKGVPSGSCILTYYGRYTTSYAWLRFTILRM